VVGSQGASGRRPRTLREQRALGPHRYLPDTYTRLGL
jgi:hypothetical protein